MSMLAWTGLVVAQQFGPESQRVERLLIHEVQPAAVGVQIGCVDHDEVGLSKFLAGFEGFVEDRARDEVAHLDAHERLPSASGRAGHFDIEGVIRRAFVLEKHLSLDIYCFNERCHPEDSTP